MARACRVRRACAAPTVAILVAVLGLGAGCGPIVYVGEVRHASEALDTARAAHAEKYAPYWWTRATEYLHKAREIAAHADFQGANRFGRLAVEAADKATEEARLAERDPSRRPLDVKPDVAPAKDAPTSAGSGKGPPASVAPAKDAPEARPEARPEDKPKDKPRGQR